MPTTIFCFSGLGADERLYAHLHLPGYTLKHIQWLPHLPSETLPQYAVRLAQQVDEAQPIFLGVSFGGMLAIEAAKHIGARQTIIISSIQTSRQLPPLHHLAYRLKGIDLLPPRLLVAPTLLMDYLFGTESKEDKELLHSFMHDTSPEYLKWALKVIMQWKNTKLPPNLYHIHGTKDRVIPMPKRVHYAVKQGGHLMIYNRPDELSRIIQTVLKNL